MTPIHTVLASANGVKMAINSQNKCFVTKKWQVKDVTLRKLMVAINCQNVVFAAVSSQNGKSGQSRS